MRWQLVFLVLYSISILLLESLYGQDYIRLYMTDLEGDVLLYGINTTISMTLLAFTALIFYLCYVHERTSNRSSEESKFFLLQCLIFVYLAIDERFLLHERIGYVLGIHDAFPLLFVGMAELFLLLRFRQIRLFPLQVHKYVILAGIGFVLMMTLDVFAPSRAFLRLSAEDLFKLWAVFFLFRYAMDFYTKLKLKKTSV